MTAGSWIYIGTQGIVQGTYETFAAIARAALRRVAAPGGSSLTAGCGGMGGAQPLAVDDERRRLPDRRRRPAPPRAPRRDALPRPASRPTSTTALARGRGGRSRPARRCSIGLVGNAADVLRASCCARGVVPDIVTDQTTAHDPLVGYVPAGLSLEQAAELRESRPRGYIERARAVDGARTCARWWLRGSAGATVFDYGNNLRAEARARRASRAPSTTRASCPRTCGRCSAEGIGPFRWAALSGDPDDIAATDARDARAVPRQRGACSAGCDGARSAIAFQGLPARICWLGYGERAPRRAAVQRARALGRGPARRS